MKMKVSPSILNLKPYVPGLSHKDILQKYGLKEVEKLSSNENPLGPSPKVLKFLPETLPSLHFYPEASHQEAKQALAQHCGVSPKEVAMGNGANELIDLLIRIFCEPNTSILTSKGAFIAYRVCAHAARVKVLETPMDNFGFDLAALLEVAKKEKPPLIFITNPNNPTGSYIPNKELQKFVDEITDSLVVIDEAYWEFVKGEDTDLEKRPHVIRVRTMSKAYGLAGIRCGYLLADPSVVDLVERVRNPFNINILAQKATPVALGDQEHVKNTCEQVWRGLETCYEALEKQGVKFYPSEGNFIFFESPKENFVEKLISQGVIVRPLLAYGLESHSRVTMGTDEQNETFLKAVKKVL